MKKDVSIMLGLIFVLVFGFMSCASNGVVAGNKIYSDEKAIIQAGDIQEIATGKITKDELKEKSFHVEVENGYSIPVSVYKLSLEKDIIYNFTLKSVPNGLISLSAKKKSVMIPRVLLYDEDFNLVENQNLQGKTIAPTTFEPLVFKVTTKWNINKTGKYYLVVKSDMSSDQGITLTVSNYTSSTDVYFKRVPYGKYSIEISK